MRAIDIQTCGSLTVFGSFACAEGTALFLNSHPGSPIAWRLTLEVFRAFEWCRVPSSPLNSLFRPDFIWLLLGLLVASLLARWSRFRFGVALLANLSFLAAIGLAKS